MPRGLDTCKSVLTVLDLVPALYPETIGLKHWLAYKLYFLQSLRQADKLVTISQGSRNRLQKVFGRLADEVVFPGIGQQFRVPSAEQVKRVRDRYRLEGPYLLAVATLEPRKNLEALLQVLIQLKQGSQVNVPDLALVGQVGWKADRILRTVRDARSAGIRIVQTGYVSDEDLPALYGASSAFVFPSIYEGFGMPVLEALKCGTYVLASNVPEIREAGGDHATYFDPTVQAIKQALEQFFQSDTYLQPDRKLDPERFALIASHGSTWQEEGKKLAAVIRSLL